MDKTELSNYVECRYDEYLMKTENRGISYGEIVHIQNLTTAELNVLLAEIDGEA